MSPTRPTRPEASATAEAESTQVTAKPGASQEPATQTASAVASDAPDEAAPEIELTESDWDQLQERIARHKGKIVVVDVWSTSCEPCLREFPNLVALQAKYAKDVVCISFDCDFIGAKNKPVAYYRERVLKNLSSLKADRLTNLICTQEADELFQKINVDSIPAVFVYKRDGSLAKQFDNRTPVSETEQDISYEKQVAPLVAELLKTE